LAQINQNLRARLHVNTKASRRRERRRTRVAQLIKVAGLYEEKHGVNPVDLLHEDHVSDYASGPETDSDEPESMEEWKVRMGKLTGMDPVKNEAIWEQSEFWE